MFLRNIEAKETLESPSVDQELALSPSNKATKTLLMRILWKKYISHPLKWNSVLWWQKKILMTFFVQYDRPLDQQARRFSNGLFWDFSPIAESYSVEPQKMVAQYHQSTLQQKLEFD